jgi:hypothetical protein
VALFTTNCSQLVHDRLQHQRPARAQIKEEEERIVIAQGNHQQNLRLLVQGRNHWFRTVLEKNLLLYEGAHKVTVVRRCCEDTFVRLLRRSFSYQ